MLCATRNQPGGLRRAYMGHLIRVANYVADFGKQGKNANKIQQLLHDLSEDLRDRWLQFVETKVAPANRNNEIIPVTVKLIILQMLVLDDISPLIFFILQSHMVAPRVSSDEEETDIIRHSLPKDTAAQEVIKINHYIGHLKNI